jgi:hypothetical protein
MSDEVLSFAKSLGATDLKSFFDNSEYRGLFKRRNYFMIDKDKFLIIKISRNKIRPFYGFGKAFLDLFNILTEKSSNYYFVALESNRSGWVLSKQQILNMISNKSLSCSGDQREYKINNYNLNDQDYFT